MKTNQSRLETLKKRYQVYRKLGYDSRTARALSQRSLDVSDLSISKKTGSLKRNKATKQFINVKMDQYKKEIAVDSYNKRVAQPLYRESNKLGGKLNDTNYTPHGLLTKDKKFKGENGKIVSIIRHENNLSNDQAYYFFYFMTKYNYSYEDAKMQLLSNRDFEEYDKRKRERIMVEKQKRNKAKTDKLVRQIDQWKF